MYTYLPKANGSRQLLAIASTQFPQRTPQATYLCTCEAMTHIKMSSMFSPDIYHSCKDIRHEFSSISEPPAPLSQKEQARAATTYTRSRYTHQHPCHAHLLSHTELADAARAAASHAPAGASASIKSISPAILGTTQVLWCACTATASDKSVLPAVLGAASPAPAIPLPLPPTSRLPNSPGPLPSPPSGTDSSALVVSCPVIASVDGTACFHPLPSLLRLCVCARACA